MPATKKQKQEQKAPREPASTGFLVGVKVFVPTHGIKLLDTRLGIWRNKVPQHGGRVTQDPGEAGITHVLVGDSGTDALPPQLQPPRPPPVRAPTPASSWSSADSAPRASSGSTAGTAGPAAAAAAAAAAVGTGAAGSKRSASPPPPSNSNSVSNPVSGLVYVRDGWLGDCLAAKRLLDPAAYRPPAPAGPSGEQLEPRWRRWLGEDLWSREFEGLHINELALQAVYDSDRSARIGNEGVVQALLELAKYERALQQDYSEVGGERVFNRRSLRYAKVASAVRACAYCLTAPVQPGELPYVEKVGARQINDTLATGTCPELEAFRANRPVCDSRGKLREDSAGAAARACFLSLPGVGQRTAARWWQLGLRRFEDLEAAVQPGGLLAPGGPHPLTPAQRCSLRHRADLLEGTNEQEVAEFKALVEAGLEAVSAPGWQVQVVGGQARHKAHHDADLLACHPTLDTEGLIHDLCAHLIKEGRLLPPEEAMCMVQSGRMPRHLDKIRQECHEALQSYFNPQMLDQFDHVYGVCRTPEGRLRRLDVIIAPPEELPIATVGWIGSRQYNRFLRQHARHCGMFLLSHRLLREVGAEIKLVPDEAPPGNRAKQDCWPPGWGPGRRIHSDRDMFELLGVPYRPPWERDCPG